MLKKYTPLARAVCGSHQRLTTMMRAHPLGLSAQKVWAQSVRWLGLQP